MDSLENFLYTPIAHLLHAGILEEIQCLQLAQACECVTHERIQAVVTEVQRLQIAHLIEHVIWESDNGVG